MKFVAYILILTFTCTACAPTQTGPSSTPPSSSVPLGPPGIETGNAMVSSQAEETLNLVKKTVISHAEIQCGFRENSERPIEWISLPVNMFTHLIDDHVTWEPLETFTLADDESAIYCGTGTSGYIVFPLDKNEADIILLNESAEPIMAVKNIDGSELETPFRDRVKSWFSVSEVSISQIHVPNDSAIEDLPVRVMELYCVQFRNLSSINPYSITNIEVFSIGEIEFQKNGTVIRFSVEYAVKPVNLDFPDWWAGGAIELLENEYSGWLMLSKEISLRLDTIRNRWDCLR